MNRAEFAEELGSGGWQRLAENPDVQVKLFHRQRIYYLLARSKPRRQKERAIRRRQRHGLARGLARLQARIAAGRLKSRDKILEALDRLTWDGLSHSQKLDLLEETIGKLNSDQDE